MPMIVTLQTELPFFGLVLTIFEVSNVLRVAGGAIVKNWLKSKMNREKKCLVFYLSMILVSLYFCIGFEYNLGKRRLVTSKVVTCSRPLIAC